MNLIYNPLPRPIVMQLNDMCTHHLFPWYHIADTTFNDGRPNPYGEEFRSSSFAHQVIDEYNPVSDHAAYFMSALTLIADQVNYNVRDIYRVRLGLCYPDNFKHHTPHTDYEWQHTTCLYYVNKSDGDTYFFSENGDITRQVTPERGKMVVFDGLTKHASSAPTKGIRIAMNVNFKRLI